MRTICWEDEYRRQAPRLLGLCRRYVHDTTKARDLLHDAFLTAIVRQSQYNGKGPVGAWLRTITLNTVLMHLRRESVWQRQLAEMATYAEAYEEPELILDINEHLQANDLTQADLLHAIDALPTHYRAVFNLYVFEQHTHQQIGQALCITEGTSKSYLARARKGIQRILLRQLEDRKRPLYRQFVALEETHRLDEALRGSLGLLMLPIDQVLPSFLFPSSNVTALPVVSAGSTLLKAIFFLIFGSVLLTGRWMHTKYNTADVPSTDVILLPRTHSPQWERQRGVSNERRRSRSSSITALPFETAQLNAVPRATYTFSIDTGKIQHAPPHLVQTMNTSWLNYDFKLRPKGRSKRSKH